MLEFKFARFLIEGRRLGKTDNLEFFEKCELGIRSIPINALMAIPGTPLENQLTGSFHPKF
ncbi:MAG: hypothetical protein IKO57_05490 [Treponema sp.]|nr:hypothetical protein [Treponema sp.]